MRGRPTTLRGDRHAIRDVAAHALDTVSPAASREWLLHLAWLLRDRRAALRELRQAGHGRRAREVVTGGETYGLAGIAWWVLTSLGVLTVITGAALLLPSRRASVRPLDQGLWEAPPVMLAGAVVICLLAVLPVPEVVRESPTGSGAALAAGALALVTLGYNAARIDVLRATEYGDRTGPYLAAAVVTLLASVVLAVRAREKPPLHRVHWRRTAREAHGHLRWLRRHTPPRGAHPEVDRAWDAVLGRLERDTDQVVIAQASTLGPWHFLVAACHDGEVEVPPIRVPPEGPVGLPG